MCTFFEAFDSSVVIWGSFNDENQLALCCKENLWVNTYIYCWLAKMKKTETLYKLHCISIVNEKFESEVCRASIFNRVIFNSSCGRFDKLLLFYTIPQTINACFMNVSQLLGSGCCLNQLQLVCVPLSGTSSCWTKTKNKNQKSKH